MVSKYKLQTQKINKTEKNKHKEKEIIKRKKKQSTNKLNANHIDFGINLQALTVSLQMNV